MRMLSLEPLHPAAFFARVLQGSDGLFQLGAVILPLPASQAQVHSFTSSEHADLDHARM